MKASNPSHAFGVVFADELARCGLTDVCLAPGSRSAPLALAFAADDRMRVHVQIDERSAAFTALGLAKATRRPAAVLCTSGSAAANLHPAVVEAHEARVPLLVLTADRPPELRHTGANQTIDQLKLFGDAVRWFCEVGVPHAHDGAVAYWRSTACRGFASAVAGPAGPVHLNLSLREPLTPTDEVFPDNLEGRPDGEPWTALNFAPTSPSEEQVGELSALVASAGRGAVIAGDCDIDPDPVLEFAAAAGWPLLAEPTSNLTRGPNAIAHYDLILRTQESETLRPDVVVRIGKHGLSRSLLNWLGADVRQVLIDGDGAWLDPGRTTSAIFAADPGLLLGAAADAIDALPESKWLARWHSAAESARRAIDEILDATVEPSEPRAARDLGASLPDGANLLAAASMPVRDLNSFMAPRDGLRIVGNRGANGIDGLVSTALGIALSGSGPTCAMLGDLALLHDQNGLLLTRHAQVDCTFVVLNNDGGGIFSFLPQAELSDHFEELFGTPHGVDLADLARVYGVGHQAIARADELGPAVVGALDAGGIRIIEVRTDRAANLELHRELERAVAAALG